jgi:hypothetical protein
LSLSIIKCFNCNGFRAIMIFFADFCVILYLLWNDNEFRIISSSLISSSGF